jgi:mRNA interferase MazF
LERDSQKEYLQKEIILFPCPYTDFSSTKIRPGIIISNNNYNQHQEDLLIAPITTKWKNKYSVALNQNDILKGKIAHNSEIRVDKIMPINKNIIIDQIGITNNEILEKIIDKLIELLN